MKSTEAHITSDGIVVKVLSEETMDPKEYVVRLDKLFYELHDNWCLQKTLGKEEFERLLDAILYNSFKLGHI